MHSQLALTEHASLNLAPLILLDPVDLRVEQWSYRPHARAHTHMRVQYRCLPHWATIDRLTMYSDVKSISPPRLLLQDKSLIRRKKMMLSSPSSSLIFYSLLLFPTQRWSPCTATKPNPQCLLSALSPTYALSISPSPVAIIHQIRNGVEKTARRIVLTH